MSSSGQVHATDKDVQQTTRGTDATCSPATAADTRLSKYLNVTLSNAFEYSCPADVYTRCMDNQREKDEFKLHRWERFTVPAEQQRNLTSEDQEESHDEYRPETRQSENTDGGTQASSAQANVLRGEDEDIIFRTRSDVLGATIERRFTAWNGQDIPCTMTQTVEGDSGGPRSTYKWVTDGCVLISLTHNGRKEHMTLLRYAEDGSFMTIYTKNGQPAKAPLRASKLEDKMKERVLNWNANVPLGEHEEVEDEQLRQAAQILQQSNSSHLAPFSRRL